MKRIKLDELNELTISDIGKGHFYINSQLRDNYYFDFEYDDNGKIIGWSVFVKESKANRKYPLLSSKKGSTHKDLMKFVKKNKRYDIESVMLVMNTIIVIIVGFILTLNTVVIRNKIIPYVGFSIDVLLVIQAPIMMFFSGKNYNVKMRHWDNVYNVCKKGFLRDMGSTIKSSVKPKKKGNVKNEK